MTDRPVGNRIRLTKDIIPPPTWASDELMPPEGIDPELAVELWQRARDVTLCNEIREPLRIQLFASRIDTTGLDHVPESIRSDVQSLRKWISVRQEADAEDCGRSCASISRWAESNGHLRLARTYAETWATVNPLEAQAAATAGGYCTRLADYPRAEIWLQRAVRIGRATKDWEWYIRGYLRLGILRFNLGSYKPARRFYARAYRTAVWGGFDGLAGKARHDMMTICTDLNAFDLGVDYALEALQLYPANDPVIPYFVHDLAFLLLQAGYFRLAKELLSAALEFIPDHRRLLIYGTLARAAAGVGDREQYERLALEVQRRAAISDEGAAAALVRLADGARQYGEWDRAEQLAGAALAIAHKRHEGQPQRLSYLVLDRISIRDGSVPIVPLRRELAPLVPHFLGRLQRHSAPATSAGALTKTP